MIRKVISTTVSRLLIALINLAVVWISARNLGAEGMGTISLIILGISINQLVSSIMGGSALVYLVPRHPVIQLLMPAWMWALVVSAGGSLLLGWLRLVPDIFIADLFWISLLQSFFSINQNVLLGKEKVFHFNLMALVQVVLVLVTILILFGIFSLISVKSYIIALYISFGSAFLVSNAMIYKYIVLQNCWSRQILKKAFQFGGYLQAASFMQLFNYRLSYYIIEKYFDRATLGVFSIGVQISESVWIISKSIAMVQYARIANSNNPDYSRNLTAAFIRITTILTLAMLGVLLLLPNSFFVLIFRSDFSNLHQVIQSLSAGILSVAISLILSHFFSGSGRPWYNMVSSGIGLIFTLILGFTLIPYLGIIGAGITASAAYTAGMLYQLIVFIKISGAKWRSVWPFGKDFIKFNQFLSKEPGEM
ncbi:MAG: polysaccharide biosynthesis C-terminal domain-containing protein [Bacteroidota bacterium]